MDYRATNRTAALFLNVTLVVLEIYAFLRVFQQYGTAALASYSVLINLFAFVSALAFMLSTALRLRATNRVQVHNKPYRIGEQEERAGRYGDIVEAGEARDERIRVLRYLASVLLMVLLVGAAALELLPFGDAFDVLRRGPYIFFCILCPLLSLLSFLFLEPGKRIAGRQRGIAMLPPAVYLALVFVIGRPTAARVATAAPLFTLEAGAAVKLLLIAAALGLSALAARCIATYNERHAE